MLKCKTNFQFKTTFGPDLNVIEIQEQRGQDVNPYMKALIDFLRGILFTNIEIPDELFSARIFLLSKNESSTPELDKCRPICIQNIAVRLFEKDIHGKLKGWKCST